MGMRLKIESNQGRGDDTALNAIRLTCTDGEELVSAEQKWGDWQDYTQSADRTITAVQLRSEQHFSGDNSAANGVRFQDGEGNTYSPGDGYWGVWGDWASCPAGTDIVGFRTYVVPHLGSGDDTALERVQFECGPITSTIVPPGPKTTSTIVPPGPNTTSTIVQTSQKKT